MALHAFMKSSEFSPLGAKAPTAEVQEAHPIGELSSKTNELVSLTERDLVDDYCRQSGARLTPLYVSSESRDNDYKPGNYAVITSVIENAAIVSEENLSWDAVIDFRQDPNARASYRAFIHWLDKEMIGKSGTFIVDEVGVRMEAYKRALSKHGIQTVIGALERALDAKALVGSATTALTLESIAHLPLVSILSGAGLLIGNAAIHVATRLIERADIVASNKEIAFVHQVGQKFGA
jgi:xanthosine utilization system XapX-like protein